MAVRGAARSIGASGASGTRSSTGPSSNSSADGTPGAATPTRRTDRASPWTRFAAPCARRTRPKATPSRPRPTSTGVTSRLKALAAGSASAAPATTRSWNAMAPGTRHVLTRLEETGLARHRVEAGPPAPLEAMLNALGLVGRRELEARLETDLTAEPHGGGPADCRARRPRSHPERAHAGTGLDLRDDQASRVRRTAAGRGSSGCGPCRALRRLEPRLQGCLRAEA
jgi:hypothetical protein